MILGFPWLAMFNPEINWAEGQIKGPKIQLKTTALVAKEHKETVICAQQIVTLPRVFMARLERRVWRV
jgi:hypothetical protein